MLLIYLPKHTERSRFIFNQIFNVRLGIDFEITTDKSTFIDSQKSKICYDRQKFTDGFFIKSVGMLEEDIIKEWALPIGEIRGYKTLFPDEQPDIGFDIFSASFYLLSRYEEYLPFTADKFGRYPAKESLAYKNNFLSIPIVDIWIEGFGKIMESRFPDIACRKNSFKAILTYDIDVAYKYKGRSFWRNTGATVKDFLKLDRMNILQRCKVMRNKITDPWDVYNYLKTTAEAAELKSIYFLLLGNKSQYDRNLFYQSPAMKALINGVKEYAEIGIHPSFNSNNDDGLLKLEKERLETISGKKVTKSRQHYLKIRFPDTYQSLITVGIKEDYTMGYPEMPGFRAGTCIPYIFYNLQREEITDLKIFPVCAMEATFKYYLELTPVESFEQIIRLIEEVKKVGGTFIPIWHNDNLAISASAKSWRDCHTSMINYLKTAN